MDIKYRIIEVNEPEHSFVVRYYTDILTEEYLCSLYNDDNTPRLGENGKPLRCRTDYHLNIFDANATHEEIDRQIRLSAPSAWLQMHEEILSRDGESPAMSKVKDRLHKDDSFIHVPPPMFQPPALKDLTEEDIEELLAKLATPTDE